MHMEIHFLKRGENIFLCNQYQEKIVVKVAGNGERVGCHGTRCQIGLTSCWFDFVFQKREGIAISL